MDKSKEFENLGKIFQKIFHSPLTIKIVNTDVEKKNNEFIYKIILTLLTLVSISIIIYNLILLKKYTPIGYAIDIYSQLPSIFWNGLSIAYFIGCFFILQKEKDFKKIGIVLLFLSYFIVLLIPYNFGYFSYGQWDDLSHIGELKNIISTGHIDQSNIYPSMHSIFVSFSLICNILPNTVSLFLPEFFSILFVIGIFIFSRLFFNYDRNLSYVAIPCLFIYYLGYYHSSNIPNYIFFTLIPLILFVLFKYLNSKSPSTSVYLVIFMLVVPFSHPFVFLFILYTLLIITLFKYITKSTISSINTLQTLLICTFFMWLIYNVYFLKSLSKLHYFFINSITKPVTVQALDKMSTIDLSSSELIRFIFIFFGRYIIPLIFVALLLLHVIKNKERIPKSKLKNIFILIVIITMFGLFDAFLILNPFIGHAPIRIFNLLYIVFSMVPLFVVSINEIVLKNGPKWKTIIISSVIITSVFTLSMYGVYPSPYTSYLNIPVTYNEVDGMEWIFNYKDEKPIYDLLGSIGKRYSDLFDGWSVELQRIGKDIIWVAKVQDHLGYDKNKYFNETNKYIIITTQGELVYQTVFKKIDRYNASDFEKFRNDPNVIKIYDSLNIEIYKS